MTERENKGISRKLFLQLLAAGGVGATLAIVEKKVTGKSGQLPNQVPGKGKNFEKYDFVSSKEDATPEGSKSARAASEPYALQGNKAVQSEARETKEGVFESSPLDLKDLDSNYSDEGYNAAVAVTRAVGKAQEVKKNGGDFVGANVISKKTIAPGGTFDYLDDFIKASDGLGYFPDSLYRVASGIIGGGVCPLTAPLIDVIFKAGLDSGLQFPVHPNYYDFTGFPADKIAVILVEGKKKTYNLTFKNTLDVAVTLEWNLSDGKVVNRLIVEGKAAEQKQAENKKASSGERPKTWEELAQKYNIVDQRLLVPTAGNLSGQPKDLQNPSGILWHYSVDPLKYPPEQRNGINLVEYTLNERGFSRPPYHFYILRDGTIDWILDTDRQAYHAGSVYNPIYLAISYVDVEEEGRVPNPKQLQAVKDLSYVLMQMFGINPCNIKGHLEVDKGKQDPAGVDMDGVRQELGCK